MPAWTSARARLARAVKAGASPEVITELRRDYDAARLEHQIRSAAPKLTDGQRARCAVVLLGSDGGDVHAA